MKTRTSNTQSVLRKLKSLRKRRKKIVFTNGCFDLIHAGHIQLLNQAKRYGDILVVAVNSDASVRWLKGSMRPILPLRDRLEILSNLKCVDYVIPFSEKSPYKLIEQIKPHVLIKGGDWKSHIIGSDLVKDNGGKVIAGLYIRGKSTSQIIEHIQTAAKH